MGTAGSPTNAPENSTTEKEPSGGSTPPAGNSRTSGRSADARIAGFEADVVRHDEKVVHLEAQLASVAPAMVVRIGWERGHGPELDRITMLDRRIDLTQRMEQVAARELDRGLELGHGIEL